VLDKRRHPRFACDLEALIVMGEIRVQARGVDISRGGMCLATDRALLVPAEVQVQLTLVFGSNSFSEPLALPAKLVWCTKMPDGYQVGCMFHALSTEQAQYLGMFLRFLRGEVLADGDPNAVAEEDSEDEKDPDAEPFG
jgi:PilZ domain